jgi:CheY-like chemotaxis protein
MPSFESRIIWWHAEVIARASEHLEQHIAQPLPISVDDETRENIKATFSRSSELLSAGNFNKENIMDWLARAEFSEWNDIFIYIVKSLREEKELMPTVAKIDGHLREIEEFMESSPEGRKHLHIIRSLPRVWKEHILIINGDFPGLEFLKKLLEHEGRVETARNGREGLQKVKGEYFDVIVSDMDMPVMNGIEFYRQASAIDPEIGKRIVFFSDFSNRDYTDFIRENNLKHLIKPAPIREIVGKVSEILRKTYSC